MNARLIFVVALALFVACPACAASKKAAARKPAKQAVVKPSAPVQSAHRKSPYVGAISADAKTGKVLFRDNDEAEAYPASVTKLMTLLLVLEDVREGRYKLDDKVVTTEEVNDRTCEASWIGLKKGDVMTVRDLCYSLMVESANDSAISLGAHAAGSWVSFVGRMNTRAKEIGMSRTVYYNPNGLQPAKRLGKGRTLKYPWWPNFNKTTASDQLKLALVLLKMPEVLEFTSVKTCDLFKTADGYHVEVTRRVGMPDSLTPEARRKDVHKTFRNHNNLMVKDKQKIYNPDGSEAVDGLKTGYIDAGGSSVVVTARRNGHRVVAVVLGSASAKERDATAARLVQDALGAVAW